MKKTILVLCAISALLVAQDAAGQYKLTGVDVLYTYITRAENVLTVSDAYGLGVTVPVATIPASVPFTTQAMQLNNAALGQIGINLNVTLNEDGSGAIAEGSYYPDVNTITDENGDCVTLQQVLPVTDEFTYTSMGNMMAAVGMAHPGINVLGIPGISPKAGQQMGGLQLASSLTFENFPMYPEHPTLCTPNGECFDFTVGDIDQSGTLEIYPDVNLLGIPEYVPGGAPLTGLTAGYWLKEGVNAAEGSLSSVFPGNTSPDFHLEWHGVDGAASTLGFGDDECDGCEDEDGDGTWYDRIVGIPGITATYMNPACGFNLPIFGDVYATFDAMGMGACVDYIGSAASGYLMDASLAPWGGFLTANSATYSGTLAACEGAGGLWNMAYGACLQGGGDAATCSAQADGAVAGYGDCTGYCGATIGFVDDSDHDFNGVDGRLTMNFDIPCVGVIEAREVVAEFVEVGGAGCASGDLDANGNANVLDIVQLVGVVLNNGCVPGSVGTIEGCDCTGDMNSDSGLNVLDVVALVNAVLGGSRTDEATSATFEVIGNEVTMTANGYVGAVQMTLSHGKDFQIELTDNAIVADYSTKGTTTTLIIVVPEENTLFSTNGSFTIESVLAAANSEGYMNTKVVVPTDFAISAAYPNPFNPTTQMTLALHTQADVSVKVFNMTGQLVDVIAEGQMDKGSYSLTWDGTNASSGVYFVKTEVGSVVQNQKIMFVK
jgi:hypothetical protein